MSEENNIISVTFTDFKDKIKISGIKDVKECLKIIRKFLVERVPDANFLKFLDEDNADIRAVPDIFRNGSKFMIVDDVCIIQDTHKVFIEFGELNDTFALVEGTSFKELVQPIINAGEV